MERVIEGNRRGKEGARDAEGINGKALPRRKSTDPHCFIPQDCIPQTPGYPTSKAEADEVGR